MVQLLCKAIWQCLNGYTELPYGPAILLLGTTQEKANRYSRTKTLHTQMFIAALFTVDKSGNNPNVHRLKNGVLKTGMNIE